VNTLRTRLVFLLAVFLLFLPAGPAGAEGELYREEKAVAEVMDYLYRYHIARPDARQLMQGAIDGLLNSVGDPYTEYFSAGELEDFARSLEGSFAGVGLELEACFPYPRVSGVFPGSPAFRAGIREGDLIVRVDGEETSGLDLARVAEKIRGPAGSRLWLTVRRGGSDFDVELTREVVSSPVVEGRMLAGNIGYVKVHVFGSRTAGEFGALMREFQSRGIGGLILDLRGDPGGYLQAAVDLAGYFLPPGQVVAITVDRNGREEVYSTAGENPDLDLPLAVLVDGMSASAAEVLAGALQEYHRAVLVGGRTYGKGVAQAIVPLEAGGALKITIARFLTPSGRSIDGRGIEPDRQVSVPSLQLVAACQELQPHLPRSVTFNFAGGVMVDGERVDAVVYPLVADGEIYIPLRFTLEALGFNVQWHPDLKQISIRTGSRELILEPGSKTVFAGGKNLKLKNLTWREGNIYLPVSPLSLLGIKVQHDAGQLKLELLPDEAGIMIPVLNH
jgi:carboxyl-terminal processing protease